MKTKEDVLKLLTNILVEEFELDAGQIHPDAHLYQDLDLDSIDAVDLVVKLRELTGRKIEPEALNRFAPLASVVDEVFALSQA